MRAQFTQLFILVITVTAMSIYTGCSSQSETPAPEPSESTITVDLGPEAVSEGADAEQAPETPSQPSNTPAPSDQSVTVLLGSPELTAGIPGDGPLTVDQIHDWLAQGENHFALQVELPLGLSAGAGQIQGLKDNPLTRAKIELGRQLYFDTRLSSDNSISCASCHHPEEGFARHTQFGVGVQDQQGNRNSPVSYNRILSSAQFWDGRAASLEEQAIGPIANPIEMGNTHESCVECVGNIDGYRVQFEKIFPDEGLTIETIGKAIASFERAIVTGPSPADHYEFVLAVEKQYGKDGVQDLKDDDPDVYARYEAAVAASEAMPDSARRGRELFFTDKANCTACHVGANFTDEKYHNLGVGMDKDNPDLGRFEVTKKDADRGAFKTPTVRNVVASAPYMHDGSQATLEEVIDWYDKGGHPNPHLSDKMKKLNLTDQDKKDLLDYLKALTGDFPPIQSARLPE